MTGGDHSDIDRVREATDLVRLVSEHVSLKPRGREHVGLCPFHEDHKPSFAVVTHKGDAFYHCFACGASGDCFRFVMNYHKIEFPEALRLLADRAGIELSKRRAPTTSSGPGREAMQEVLERACTFFQRTLDHPEQGRVARETIAARGIAPEMVEAFRIGAAPEGYEGLRRAIDREPGFRDAALAASLLKRRKEGDGTYDAFRHRLIFPIMSDFGRVVAFGGRVLDKDDQPKYLNSAESSIFSKSRTLYGLHLAKRAIIAERQAIITEGYTDVIACHQAGITNTVGTLGTALTTDHARILTRLCDTVVLIFDGDEAGQRAADRAIQVFFAEPVDVRICVLPEGTDPDELLARDGGRDALLEAVAAAQEALAYRLDRFRAELDRTPGLSGRQQALERFLGELADLGFHEMAGVRKHLVWNRLSELLGIPVPELERALPTRRRGSGSSRPAAATGETSSPELLGAMAADAGFATSRARRLAERDVVALLLSLPPQERERDVPLPRLETPVYRRIVETIAPVIAAGDEVRMGTLLTELDDDVARAEASRLFVAGHETIEQEDRPGRACFTEALATLDARIETERYDRAASRSAAVPAEVDASAVLEMIEARRAQGDRPAAISRGMRS